VKLLCDEMLMRLGRWLRAAGYDTAIAESGMPDREIVAQACSEERLLITRDRKMAEHRLARGRLIILNARGLHDQAREVAARLGIDWTRRPFSRCLVCNTPLKRGEDAHFLQVPPESRKVIDEVYICPGCGKTFWHGSHVARMRRKLAAWKTTHSALLP